MRWRKLGRIFDCAQVRLPDGCASFAQSPQALVFESHTRIYFSTRQTEAATPKVLSRVAYADFSQGLDRLLRVSEHSVLLPGKRGTFDEHGVFPLSPLRVGRQVYGYTSGASRRQSVPVESAIGLVISNDDGQSFQRYADGPILGPSLHEPCIVADAFVRQFGGRFHMWHIFGSPWLEPGPAQAPERVYKIGHTTSGDGISWRPGGGQRIIADVLGEDECQALPTVFARGGRWFMIFCYRHASDFRSNPARAYRLGLAESDDLVSWRRIDDQLELLGGRDGDDWDARMQCYPHVFERDGKVYLLYNGNAFGRDGFGAAVLEGQG